MKVRYSRRANRDLEAISSYLHERSPTVAGAVVNRIEHRIAQLETFSLMGPITPEPAIRALTVRPYPYKVYYRIDDDEIVIMHIRHGRRAPWRGDD